VELDWIKGLRCLRLSCITIFLWKYERYPYPFILHLWIRRTFFLRRWLRAPSTSFGIKIAFAGIDLINCVHWLNISSLPDLVVQIESRSGVRFFVKLYINFYHQHFIRKDLSSYANEQTKLSNRTYRVCPYNNKEENWSHQVARYYWDHWQQRKGALRHYLANKKTKNKTN